MAFEFIVWISFDCSNLQVCSARFIPSSFLANQTTEEWTETAKQIGLKDEQQTAIVDLLQFLRDYDLTSVTDNNTRSEFRNTVVIKFILQNVLAITECVFPIIFLLVN